MRHKGRAAERLLGRVCGLTKSQDGQRGSPLLGVGVTVPECVWLSWCGGLTGE